MIKNFEGAADMSEYTLSTIDPRDSRAQAQMDALLQKEGIRRDGHLDYSIGLFDEDYNLVATGSCFANTLRCMAVDSAHQGEGLMNRVVSELIQFQCERGNTHLFLYTKWDKAPVFRDLGFYSVAGVPGKVAFLENRPTGFSGYLEKLRRETTLEGAVHGAVVMNANPFTLGHQYLLEQASGKCDVLHVFMVSEDVSLVPFRVRKALIREGSARLHNLVYHETGSYMISNATFPSYFLKEEAVVMEAHARLDIAVFTKIAEALNISVRFAGEEPFSQVTGIYNTAMVRGLNEAGIECEILPRLSVDGQAVSASQARRCLQEGDFEGFKALVPQTTAEFFASESAAPVLKRIRECPDVVHF